MKTTTEFMEKPSCINKLKDLADSLSDRDVNVKKCMAKVKEVLHDETLSESQIVDKLKEICNTYGK